MTAPDFWDHQESAQKTVADMQRLNGIVGPMNGLVAASDDMQVLMEFAEEEAKGLEKRYQAASEFIQTSNADPLAYDKALLKSRPSYYHADIR